MADKKQREPQAPARTMNRDQMEITRIGKTASGKTKNAGGKEEQDHPEDVYNPGDEILA